VRSTLAIAAPIGLYIFTAVIPLPAQMQNNTEKQMACDNHDHRVDRMEHCEIREQSFPSVGRLSVEGHNGGITVKGWVRNEVLVRARVDATAETQAAADSLASRVSVDISGGMVRSTGPDMQGDDQSSWSVSYEVFAPQTTDLSIKTHNGGLVISDVRGQIRFEGHNGGVVLKRVTGDIGGNTHNGRIQIEIVGPVSDGRQLEASTHNGSITVAMPANYSAHVLAETSTGHIQSDFPISENGERRARQLDTSIGSGGPLMHLTTHNGEVALKRTGL